MGRREMTSKKMCFSYCGRLSYAQRCLCPNPQDLWILPYRVKESLQMESVLKVLGWGHYLVVVVVPSLTCVWPFVTPWTAARQAFLSFSISWSLFRFMSIELVLLSNHLILCLLLLLPPSIFPSNRIFFTEVALHIKWLKYWSFSFNISPSSEYSGLISLILTGLISLQSKELSRIFSNTTVQKHQFFSTQLSLWSNSHIHTWSLEKSYLWLEGSLSAK